MGAKGRTGRRSSRPLILAASLLACGAVAVAAWVFVRADRSTPVDRREALSRFDDAMAQTPEVVSPRSSPPAGVYEYRTSGVETLSFAGAEHELPEVTYARVVPGADCEWTLEHDVLDEHLDSYRFCASSSRVELMAWTLRRTFLGRSREVRYRCEDATARALIDIHDRSRSLNCGSDTGGTANGTLIQSETRQKVGTEMIDAIAIAVDLTFVNSEGDASGDGYIRMVLDPRSGLRLHEARTLEMQIDGPAGPMQYREDATFTLSQLTPL